MKEVSMIEAWQIEHRPILYALVRRIELVRWTLREKVFHADARWYARPLALWLALTCYEAERCCLCGWKVNAVWWCEDQVLWETVTGYQNESGISCMKCFERRADRMGISLRWRVDTLMSYSEEEWLRIIKRNEQFWKGSDARETANKHAQFVLEEMKRDGAQKSGVGRLSK